MANNSLARIMLFIFSRGYFQCFRRMHDSRFCSYLISCWGLNAELRTKMCRAWVCVTRKSGIYITVVLVLVVQHDEMLFWADSHCAEMHETTSILRHCWAFLETGFVSRWTRWCPKMSQGDPNFFPWHQWIWTILGVIDIYSVSLC